MPNTIGNGGPQKWRTLVELSEIVPMNSSTKTDIASADIAGCNSKLAYANVVEIMI